VSGLFPAKGRKDSSWLWRHSLSITLLTLLAAQTALALWNGAYVFTHEQPFGKGVEAWSGPFWQWWVWAYNVSLVADTFGVVLIVLLSKWLYEQGSSESE
jgi:hypothetical protein